MAETWVGLANQASAKYSKDLTDLTIRNQIGLALIERAGNLKLDVDGSFEAKYPIDYKDAEVSSFGLGSGITYAPFDPTKLATLDWRGMVVSDMMGLKERAMMDGSTAQFVNRYKRIIPKELKSMRKKIGLELYTDGGADGNENRFCGMETLMGQGTCVVADLVGQPDDTYNSIDTDVATAGTWSSDLTTPPNEAIDTDWPEGTGDPEYDYWSPKLINWSSTSWPSGASNSWTDTGAYVLRRTAQWLLQTAGIEGDTLLALLNGQLLTDFKNAQETKLRTLATHPTARDLGFPNVLEYDGMMLKSEYGVPVNTGYVLNMDEVELLILKKKFITTHGPILDPDSAAYKWFAYTFGNFKFVPKFCAKLYNYASA